MKTTFVRRCIPLLLTLVMVAGLFTVCFGVAAADTRDLKLKTFYAAELAGAAEAAGTVNEHGVKIYTTYQDTIGRKSVNPGNYMLHSLLIPFQEMGTEERAALKSGDTVRITVRLSADESYFDGDLCQIEWLLGGGSYGQEYQTDMIVDFDGYTTMAEDGIDEQYGYEYKEMSFDVPLEGEYWDAPLNSSSKDQAQIRIKGTNEAPVTIYYISCQNIETEQMLLELDGVAIGSREGVANYWENVYPEGDQVSGIASYMGLHPHRNNDVEPYCYNCDGFDHKGNAALLMDSLGMELDAGSYALGVKMKTQQAMGTTDKCEITLMAGENELKKHVVSNSDITQAGGSGGGYCEIRIPFTVPEEKAGQKITFKVELYNSNDFGLAHVSMYMVVDADAPVPTEAQAVIDSITGLDIADIEATAAARAAYDALTDLNKAWVGDELAGKLTSYERIQSAAAAASEAITGLGSKDDITDANYTEKTTALEAAEKLYNDFVQANGQETADQMITNAAILSEYRAAYNAAEETAKEKAKAAAIQKANDAIAAIGGVDEITEENVDAKQELVDAAKAAVDELTTAYGQDILSDVSNYTNIQAAQDKINEIKAVPEYTLGDANEDGEINASDALLALQHSVKLTELKDAVFSAADVDESGVVDATDALFILQYSVKLIDKFPAEK